MKNIHYFSRCLCARRASAHPPGCNSNVTEITLSFIYLLFCSFPLFRLFRWFRLGRFGSLFRVLAHAVNLCLFHFLTPSCGHFRTDPKRRAWMISPCNPLYFCGLHSMWKHMVSMIEMDLSCFLGLLLSDLLCCGLEDIHSLPYWIEPAKYSVFQRWIIQASIQACRELKSETSTKWQLSMLPSILPT